MKFPDLNLAVLLLSAFLLIFVGSPAPAADAADVLYQFCGTTGNYTANSTYDLNLQTLLTNLTTSATNISSSSSFSLNFGFAKNTVGSVPNQVLGLVLCRGDVNSSTCSSCLSQATQEIQNLCPYYKEATIYYDFCLLRFSNQNFLSSTDNTNQVYMWNTQNVTGSKTQYDNYVRYLMNTTADYAAFNTSKRFATGQLNLSHQSFPAETNGLVQCTPDMSTSDCASCLNNLIDVILKQFSGRQGARILGVRCNIRYEIYSFYSGVSLLSLTPPIENNAPAPAPAITPPLINPPPQPQGKKKTSTATILAITLPLVLAFVVIAGLCASLIKRRKSGLTKPLLNVSNPEEIKSVESLLLDLSVLRVATIDFAEENKLGEGGFGAVYKGVLPDGREIAVKRLSQSSSQGMGELKNELLLVAKLQHKNLVRLLGVCLEGQEKLLVYEYVPNKSLDQILFDSEKRYLLDWGKRYKIICGIARGLLYLHEDSQLRIIHRDLKASNILLNAEMNPKISDFGLARLFGGDQTQEITNRVVGTFGYMAPEYAMRGHFSIKSDVFSYGVLVLEIITGKKNSGTFENDETEDLLSFVWQHWTNGTITVVADPSLGQYYPRSELLRCTQIALLCVQDNPADRPSMSTVAVMLSSETVSLETPSNPAFCIAKSSIRAGPFSSVFNNNGGNNDRSSGMSVPMSLNEVSITDIEPRWTSHGSYTAASAYQALMAGGLPSFSPQNPHLINYIPTMKLPHLIIPLFFFFLFLLFASPAAEAADVLYQYCGTTGNYTSNSTYQSNLQTLLTDLTKSSTNSTTNFGFAKTSVGSTPNLVYGLVLCRGDDNSSVCSSCLNQATQDIQNLCPYNKEATIYYDYCLLRYSNQNFLSSTDNSNEIIMYNTQNVSVSFTLFDNRVNYLMNSTANYAAFNNSKKFGTSQMNSTDSVPVIMGLVQCTPDMSGTDCNSCLQSQIDLMPKYFSGKQGGRILGVRCNIRYELYSFYSGAALLTVTAPAASAPAPAPSLPPRVTNPPSEGKKKTSTATILAITVPLVLVFVVIVGLYVCFLKRRKSRLTKPLLNVSNPEEIKSVESLLLDLSVLRVATTDFAEENKLGEGGFGVVYKGVLPDGREIAVKRLSRSSGQGMGELKNELLLVAKLQHKNLVRLLGVCLEDQEKLLVYEYVPNKSLDQILFDTEKRHLLDWGIRYKIISGITRGLLYLHEDSQLRIIHRDLKASNILLDADMNPKISDFGLARLFGGDQTQDITSRVVGTFGYMAPEYAMRGHFSVKSDVFSYGVLVLEIITGKKNSATFENDQTEDLLSFVWQHWTNGTITEVADPSLDQHYPRSELLRCTQIALLCVQDNPADRPTMSTVAVMLSSETVSLETPSRPAFCITKTSIRAGSFSSGFINIGGNTDRSSTKSIPMSPNEVSITDIEPR
ncbi:uncharacterized protein LOC144565483 [Carex rostrata]